MPVKKKVVVEARVLDDPTELLALINISLNLEFDIPGFEVSTATPIKLRQTPQNEQIVLLLCTIEEDKEELLRQHPNVIDVSANPAVFALFEKDQSHPSGVP